MAGEEEEVKHEATKKRVCKRCRKRKRSRKLAAKYKDVVLCKNKVEGQNVNWHGRRSRRRRRAGQKQRLTK